MNNIISTEAETTGKYLVLFDEEADIGTDIQTLQDRAGINNVVKASDFEDGALNLEEVSVGVKVEQIMDTVGVITASCDAQIASTLPQIEGVAAVEEEQEYQLPPPDSEIQ